jgi:hypothetical protein
MSVAMAIMLNQAAAIGTIMVLSGTFAKFFTFSMTESLAFVKFRNCNVFKVIWFSNFLNISDGMIKEIIYSF